MPQVEPVPGRHQAQVWGIDLQILPELPLHSWRLAGHLGQGRGVRAQSRGGLCTPRAAVGAQQSVTCKGGRWTEPGVVAAGLGWARNAYAQWQDVSWALVNGREFLWEGGLQE